MGRASKRSKQQEERGIHVAEVLVAYHEAAHCVVGTLLGGKTQYVWIKVKAGGFRQPDHPGWYRAFCSRGLSIAEFKALNLDDTQREYIFNLVVGTLAGPLAEDAASKQLGHILPSDSHLPGSDQAMSLSACTFLAGGIKEDADRLFQSAWNKANDVLAANWTSVVAVAVELVKRQHLTGAQIEKLVASVVATGGGN